MPDRRAGEAVHLRDAELRRSPRRVLHPLGRPVVNTVRIAVTEHLGRQNRPVALVDAVADRLADEVRADRPHVQTVPLEERTLLLGVPAVGDRLVDLEVVAPARELETVEAPAGTASGQLLER